MRLDDIRRKVASRLGPFWLYGALALALNAYPLAATIRAGIEYNGDFGACRRAMSWIYTDAYLCAIHIVAAIYIAIIGRELVRRWEDEVVTTRAAGAAYSSSSSLSTSGAHKTKSAAGTTEPQAQPTEAKAAMTTTAEASAPYVKAEDGESSWDQLADVADVAASAPTAVDVLRNLSGRWTLRVYILVVLFYLAWTTVGMKRHMMNVGYCGGNLRMHVADCALCAVLFLTLGQGALCFGAWRAGRIMAQGRVSGLDIPAYGVEA